jgi:hypothetical protein
LKNIIGIGCLLASVSAFSAINLKSINTTSLPSVDIFKVHSQDVENEKLGNAPRFAVEHNVNINSFNNPWVKEGDLLISRHRVKATNAVSLNFAFDFKMTQDSKVKIYSSDLTKEIREFTINDNNIDN